MAQLYNLQAVYPLITSLYGLEVDTDQFEDVALVGWEQIGNKHTRLYRYKASTKNCELELPCNVDEIDSVHIPIVDAQITSNKTDFADLNSIYVEEYIDAWNLSSDPYNEKGKLVKYTEGDNTLYFTKDYSDVVVVYKGIIVDDETGLPLVNNRELNAIASYVAWRELLKDGIRRRNKDSLALAQIAEREWINSKKAARVVDHLSQNDMNAILDVKYRWDRKQFNKSLKPTI